MTAASANTVSISETDPTWSPYSATPGTFLITRTGRLDALTINLQFGGTAVAGTDYQTLSNAVTLPLGASSVAVSVMPLNSSMNTVVGGFAPGTNYQIGSPTSATMTLAPGPTAMIRPSNEATSGLHPVNRTGEIELNG